MRKNVYVRVTMHEDGRNPKYELMLDGTKITDMTSMDIVNMVMQASSSLRWSLQHELP
jgi:hypothetical protein